MLKELDSRLQFPVPASTEQTWIDEYNFKNLLMGEAGKGKEEVNMISVVVDAISQNERQFEKKSGCCSLISSTQIE